MKIHIVGGTGKMGRWLKNFFESQNLAVTVSGKNHTSEIPEDTDVVFISVPIETAPEVIKETSILIAKDCLLVDLSSVKNQTVEALKKTKKAACALHLLFGPAISSIQNQKIILCRVKDHPLISEIIKIFEDNGTIVLEMTPQEHDKKMSYIQNLTHFINLSLAKLLLEKDVDLTGKISTPVFLSQLSTLSRVISQDPDLLVQIQINNPNAIEALENFIHTQKDLIELIKSKKNQVLKEEINKIHSALESTRRADGLIDQSQKSKVLGKIHTSLGYLGPKGTFSHQAALNIFEGDENKLKAFESIYQIFQAVKENVIEYGIVPAENSTEGTVRETLDFLLESNLKTNGSLNLEVHQNLLSKEKDIEDIKEVCSHPQALAQSRKFIEEKLQGVKVKVTRSTVPEDDIKKEGVAIIASTMAAKIYNLNILASNIENEEKNITKFYIISKKESSILSTNKTLLFLTVFNKVGILRDILEVISSFNINLFKIESRPSREKVWDYYFFMEVDAKKDDPKLSQALDLLKQFCPKIRVLGEV